MLEYPNYLVNVQHNRRSGGAERRHGKKRPGIVITNGGSVEDMAAYCGSFLCLVALLKPYKSYFCTAWLGSSFPTKTFAEEDPRQPTARSFLSIRMTMEDYESKEGSRLAFYRVLCLVYVFARDS